MKFAIERASARYLSDLECSYENWDDEYFLRNVSNKPVDVDKIYKKYITFNEYQTFIWVIDDPTMEDLIEIMQKANEDIVLSNNSWNDVAREFNLGVITIYDGYLE